MIWIIGFAANFVIWTIAGLQILRPAKKKDYLDVQVYGIGGDLHV
jgi:hypothetical protein